MPDTPQKFVEQISKRPEKKVPTESEQYVRILDQKDTEGMLEKFIKEQIKKGEYTGQGLLMVALYLKKKIMQEHRRELINLFDDIVDAWEQKTGEPFPHNLTEQERMAEL